jgi:hypothetical protein
VRQVTTFAKVWSTTQGGQDGLLEASFDRRVSVYFG